jgi:hypothetical protein
MLVWYSFLTLLKPINHLSIFVASTYCVVLYIFPDHIVANNMLLNDDAQSYQQCSRPPIALSNAVITLWYITLQFFSQLPG